MVLHWKMLATCCRLVVFEVVVVKCVFGNGREVVLRTSFLAPFSLSLSPLVGLFRHICDWGLTSCSGNYQGAELALER